MCLIIFTPNIRRARIHKTVLARGFHKNDDGAGFAYVQDGKVIVSKGFFEFDEFYQAYADLVPTLKGPLLIHFRWLTKGSKTFVNTQPLSITPDLAMAHNGKIDELSNHDEDISDSVRLVRLIRRLKWSFPFSRAQHDLLALVCDGYSKLVFLNGRGQYQIINSQLGSWRAGAWYSDQCECFKVPAKGYAQFYTHKATISDRVKVKQSRLVKPQTVREREMQNT